LWTFEEKLMLVLTQQSNYKSLPGLALPQTLARLTIVLAAMLPLLCYAQVSVESPARQILTLLAAGFAVIAGIGVIFCTIAGIFGFAQWTRLLNIIGWIVAGGGGLSIATWAAAQAV
jgi:type IV secretory pathway VirB2 component (pilin)